MNNDLLAKLVDKRKVLREKLENDRAPFVCSDASLAEIARLEPKNKEDLLCIIGLGKSFVEKYGDEFMSVLNAYHSRQVREGALCPEVRSTLKNLENRLVNVNKRNRLLYMPKLSANYSFDLARGGAGAATIAYNARLADFIKHFDEGKRYTICDATQSELEAKKYKQLTGLLREVNRTYRESGENCLYIAYPFVIGKMLGEDFSVRAPLVLFPVEAIIEASSVCIKMDVTKDALYNSSLILSFNKFNNINTPLPSPVLEDLDPSKFMAQLTEFYANNGIKLLPPTKDIKTFAEYTAAAFPRLKSGEFHIENSMVLGKFSMYSSALQKDFHDIIESDNINELLNDLLQRYEDIDIYSDSEEPTKDAVVSPYIERNLNYINDLNISQETALCNISSGNKLVVQGPPGTGKSQTITSMIADFVNKGKNVLMVSQKKAALDVIYSRLGKLNRYAALLNDVKNKDYFYDQLYNIFSAAPATEYNKTEFTSVSEAIDGGLKRLDTLADKLYYDNKYGLEMYKIYEEDTHSTLSRADSITLNKYAENIPQKLFSLGYSSIKRAAKILSNEQILTNTKNYYDLVDQFNWLIKMKNNLSQIEVSALVNLADEIVDLYVAYRGKKMFSRAKTKRAFKRGVKSFVSQYFLSADKSVLKLFYADPTNLYNGMEAYTKFYGLKAKYDELDADVKLLFGATNNVAKELGASVATILPHMVEYAAYYYINEFEVENRETMTALDNYGIILRDIAANLSRKKELSRDRLKATLVRAINDNILSGKRKGEMERVIDGKRKWNIARFINKFSFELFNGIKIWLMTPEVVSEVLPLENGLFDLLIFDEASQIYIEKGVPSIARAKKVVIAGDHKQLRPSSLGVGRMDYDEDDIEDDDTNAALEEESLLDLARFKYPEILLNYHYRSRYEELIAFSNYAFYKGRLNVSPNVDVPKNPPIQVHYTPDGLWQNRQNTAEATEVIGILVNFLKTRQHNETVGVITFNSSQRDLIYDMLDELCASDSDFAAVYKKETMRAENGEDVGLFVKNIENVQGDERDQIIFSLAYAKGANGKVVRNFGWLNQAGGENRLNVAISRAKQKIDLVTSVKAAELKVDDLTNEGPRILKKYLEYAYFISDGNTDAAREVLRSFGGMATEKTDKGVSLVSDVMSSLASEGLDAERNVGIGTYKIDIAIKDASGKYLLGLECDSALYPFSHLARERDVHRRKYLESRGWKLYRIWSSNWWRDSKLEIEKIKKIISKM